MQHLALSRRELLQCRLEPARRLLAQNGVENSVRDTWLADVAERQHAADELTAMLLNGRAANDRKEEGPKTGALGEARPPVEDLEIRQLKNVLGLAPVPF